MKLRRKTILLLIFSSFMSVGWGQDCDDGYVWIDEFNGYCWTYDDGNNKSNNIHKMDIVGLMMMVTVSINLI